MILSHQVERRGRRRQRGQVIPVAALMALVILGGAALAVDLSLQTHDQRTLQNVTDAAALSGAQDLPLAPASADQYQGAQDALQIIRKRMGWQSLTLTAGGSPVTNASWAQTLASKCSGTSGPTCDITKTVCSNATPQPGDLPASCDSYASLSSNAHYFSITIQSPARTSNVLTPAQQADLHYFEVVMAQDTQNYIAGALGIPVSTQASRSTAYHYGPRASFGFALFAKSFVQTQNKSTLVVGDVYADRYVSPQSAGKAGICASGLLVLGAPQTGVPGPMPADGQDNKLQVKSAYPIHYDPTNCSATVNSTGGGTVNQGRNPKPAGACTVSGVTSSMQYDPDPAIETCVANPSISAPSEPPPTQSNPNSFYTGCVTATDAAPASGGVYSCTANKQPALTITSSGGTPLTPGVYYIKHNPSCVPKTCYDVDFSTNTKLTGVTFYLGPDATLGVHGNGTTVSINPAPPAPPPPGMVAQAQDGRYPIYSDPNSVTQVWVTDIGASLTLFGTLYIPDGGAHTYSNAYFNITGQAIVGVWDDKGGNHPTADITYDVSRTAPQVEVLKLIE